MEDQHDVHQLIKEEKCVFFFITIVLKKSSKILSIEKNKFRHALLIKVLTEASRFLFIIHINEQLSQ